MFFLGNSILVACHEIFWCKFLFFFCFFSGLTVLAFVWVPGFFYSLMTFLESDFKEEDGTTDFFSCCQKSITCFFMCFFTWIMTPGYMIAEVFNPDLTKDTKK